MLFIKNESTQEQLKKTLHREANIKPKIKALLQNQIEGLRWNYFEIDFNEIKPDQLSPDDIDKFFKDIKETSLDKFEYKSTIDVNKVFQILFSIIDIQPDILTGIIQSLFKTNEIKNESGADESLMGKLNRKNRKQRDKIFYKKIKQGFRSQEGALVILAEGDSWFQFPKIYGLDAVKDIIDWLIDDPKYAVKSLAAAGDWLSNILHMGEYIEELPKLSPDVFLLSGGGNDMLGNGRLAAMVDDKELKKNPGNVDPGSQYYKLDEKRKELDQNGGENFDYDRYNEGLKHLSDEFLAFMNIYFLQFTVFLYHIGNHPKYKHMQMITHGYDYLYPFNGSRGGLVQRLINKIVGSGRWLHIPLMSKRIHEKKKQQAIIYTMVYEFNEMMAMLANYDKIRNLYHIDFRGVHEFEDWFDEIHLKAHRYRRVARVYKYVITRFAFNKKNPNRKKDLPKVIDAKEIMFRDVTTLFA